MKLVYELIKAELFTEILGGKDVFIDQHLALNMILSNERFDLMVSIQIVVF